MVFEDVGEKLAGVVVGSGVAWCGRARSVAGRSATEWVRSRGYAIGGRGRFTARCRWTR